VKRGRKLATESRAAEIRTRLAVWKQTPEGVRISLRALAAEAGTSHQLLSFYLRQWDRWLIREYRRKAVGIRAQANAEGRPVTPGEEAQIAAYRKRGMLLRIDSVLNDFVGRIEEHVKVGKLARGELRMLKIMARKGFPKAQEVLQLYYQRANNLPGNPIGRAKSFK
jgi:hypothetical protein